MGGGRKKEEEETGGGKRTYEEVVDKFGSNPSRSLPVQNLFGPQMLAQNMYLCII